MSDPSRVMPSLPERDAAEVAATGAATAGDIVAALSRAGCTDVDDSLLARVMHAQDASLYRVVPRVVVAPRTADEVAAIVDVARDADVPITARGAGTSIAGNAIGPGIVVEFRRHLDGILEVRDDHAVVEPGVVLDDLQAAVAHRGVRFGAEPASHSRATIGGMIGNNACGARALGFGRTDDGLAGVAMVTGAGERVLLGDWPAGRPAGIGHEQHAPSARLDETLRDLVHTRHEVVAGEFARIPRQVAGYGLEHLLADDVAAPARLVAGSEGTLGLVTAARVRLVNDPAHTTLVVLGHDDLASAADSVPDLLDHRPMALEGLDARIVDAVRERTTQPVPDLPAGSGWLLVELADDDPHVLADRVADLRDDAPGRALVVDDADHARAVWRIREAGAGLAAVAPSGRRAHAGWEDSAVAPGRLGAYLRDLDDLLADHGLTGMPYGHFGDGCLHLRLDFALATAPGRDRYLAFLAEATDLATSHGGFASGEHGDGRTRSWLLARQYSDEALAAMRDLKQVFDPDGVCNPGVIVPPADGGNDLRLADVPATPGSGFAFDEDGGDAAAAAHRCTGVGACVVTAPTPGDPASTVMCPSYMATEREQDSTRGRARVLQEAMRDGLPDGIADEAVDQALDLCLSCKACATDCPTGVDMARLKSETLHRRGPSALSRSQRLLGALPELLDVAALAPDLAGRALTTAWAARLAELAGVDPRRSLPAPAPTTFTASHRRMQSRGRLPQPDRPVGRVVLWVDTFTDHFDPQAAVATMRVLVEAGLEVDVVGDECCGLTWITTGQLDAARAHLGDLVDALGRTGGPDVPIVGVEPPCVAVLRDDLGQLLPDHRRAAGVAARARTLSEVLATRRPEWSPPSLAGRTVVLQPHCHQHAVMGMGPDRALLAGTGADVVEVTGCCGLAGNWGLERGHHDVSVTIADQHLLPAVAGAPDDAIILADGFSCRTQLADLGADLLAGRRPLHLAELLAAHH